MLVFITDLDGTLLDSAYSYEAADPALKLLRLLRIPLVLCTSKTRAEVEVWRCLLGNSHPFIVENGGALYLPEYYFGLAIHSPVHRNGYSVIEFGDPYRELVQSLIRASEESDCSVRGFYQMSAEEISERCHMLPLAAMLAKQREYDEPFEILSGDDKRLTEAITRQKKRWTRGGSFHHILGVNDKAHCVSLLIHFYRKIFKNVVTIGLGDGMNDAGFLNLVDIPILLETPGIADLKKAVPRGRLSSSPGPQGWNTAVLDIIEQRLPTEGKAIGMDAKREESLSSSRI
jgi:mannosyl-3-phosphoglycerate phosphatase family protein